MKKILILDILSDNSEEKNKDKKILHGTYTKMFSNAMKINEDRFVILDAPEEIPNDPTIYSGVIIGRSTHNPIDGEEKQWMKDTYEFIRKTIKSNVPLLGICGGLHFTVRALGKEVVLNPKGKEFGSFSIFLNSAGKQDPLFEGVPKEFTTQVSHEYCVEDIQKEWKVLGSSSMCNNQVIAIGDNVRLVQFHPEIESMHLENIAKIRGLKIQTNESPYSKQILFNFLKNFIEK